MYEQPLVHRCETCRAVIFENDPCHVHGILSDAFHVESLSVSLMQLYSRAKLCELSRKLNQRFQLGVITCDSSRTRVPRGIAPLEGAPYSMLYISGQPVAFRSTSSLFLVHDALHEDDEDTAELRSAVEPIRQYLEARNALFRDYRRIQHLEPDRPPAVVEFQNGPRDPRTVGIIVREPDDLHLGAIALNRNGRVALLDTSRLLEPLCYPLLFPHGNDGWHSRHDLTLLQYLQIHIYQNPALCTYGRLGQVYLLHMYVRYRRLQAEQTMRITQVYNSTQRRLVRYHQLVEARNEEPTIIGRLACLPSSLPFTPANQREHISDLTALIVEYGPPDFFITMTANPLWPEVVSLARHKGIDSTRFYSHADIVNKAFYRRNLDLRRFLAADFFRPVSPNRKQWLANRIEYQKRLNVHSHTLFRSGVCPGDMNIDEVVTCAIPDEECELKELVTQLMVHRCSGRCNVDGKCKYGFPKPVSTTSYFDEFDRLVLRRREHERFVVSYNPTLLLRYKCHLNVEYCRSMDRPQYLAKYVTKIDDLVDNVTVTTHEKDNDPTRILAEYFRAFYISAAQAIWELLGYPQWWRSVSVLSIVVHLEGMQWVATDEIEKATDLQRYFGRPASQDLEGIFVDFDALRIKQYFSQFHVEERKKLRSSPSVMDHPEVGTSFHVQRRSKDVVVRFSHSSFLDTELNALRALLVNRPARSYELLRTIDDVVYPTFHKAAVALNLVDEDELRFALDEAAKSLLCTPRRFFHLFIFVMLNGLPDVQDAIEYYAKHMVDGTHVPAVLDPELHIKPLKRKLVEELVRHGYSPTQYGFDAPDDAAELVQQLFDPDTEARTASTMFAALDESQVHVAELFHDLGTPTYVLLDAPAGYGKSVVAQYLAAHYRSSSHGVICAAFTSFAAHHLPGGRTIHSTFGFGVKQPFSSKFEFQSVESLRLRQARLIIIDEVFTISKALLEAIDATLRDLCQDNRPFGGKSVLLMGDPRQITPVDRLWNDEDSAIKTCIMQATVVQNFLRRTLSQPHRFRDPSWAQWLLSIGEGTHTEIIMPASMNYTDEPTETFYRECFQNGTLIVAPTWARVNEHNDKMSALLGVREHLLEAVNEFCDESSVMMDPEALSQ